MAYSGKIGGLRFPAKSSSASSYFNQSNEASLSPAVEESSSQLDLPEQELIPVIAPASDDCVSVEGEKALRSSGLFGKLFSKKTEAPCWKRDPIPWPKRITLSHIVGNQGKIDFSSNYSSASLLFAPDFQCGQFLTLFDLQGHRFDDTTYAATAGLVLRYIPSARSTMQEITGLNVYYDYRQGSIGYFQEFSIGLEILSSQWELRANGYIPFGNKNGMKTCGDDACGRKTLQNYQNVSYGFNAEVGGYPVFNSLFLVYTAAGPYFISGRPCKPNTVGFEARVRPQYKDFIALDLSYNWDPLFRSVFQAEIVLYAPLYQLSRRRPVGECSRSLTLRQVYQNVERFDVMPLGRRTCRL